MSRSSLASTIRREYGVPKDIAKRAAELYETHGPDVASFFIEQYLANK